MNVPIQPSGKAGVGVCNDPNSWGKGMGLQMSMHAGCPCKGLSLELQEPRKRRGCFKEQLER